MENDKQRKQTRANMQYYRDKKGAHIFEPKGGLQLAEDPRDNSEKVIMIIEEVRTGNILIGISPGFKGQSRTCHYYLGNTLT